MTKAELIDAMKDFTDDMDVKIWLNVRGYEDIVSVVEKYVKKPVVVEAFQFGIDEEPDWFVQNDKEGLVRRIFESGNPINPHHYQQKVEIYNKCKVTFETVFYGDMIIKGIQGEIYPCKKEIFDASYEPYEDL